MSTSVNCQINPLILYTGSQSLGTLEKNIIIVAVSVFLLILLALGIVTVAILCRRRVKQKPEDEGKRSFVTMLQSI